MRREKHKAVTPESKSLEPLPLALREQRQE